MRAIYSEDYNKFCTNLKAHLDADHYGMDNIKENMIILAVNREVNPHSQATIALEGPQGTGKTSILSSLAKGLGLPFQKISLGGMIDPTILKGADSHWVGSEPSIILHFLKIMKQTDGAILFDEIDKLVTDEDSRGHAIQHALLHITDYTQNKEFQDQYLKEFNHDISNLWFFYSMNKRDTISPILLDRLTIYTVEPYAPTEMRIITQKHLLPRALKDVNIPPDQITITDKACRTLMNILESKIKEGGVRPLDQEMRKIAGRLNYLNKNKLPDGSIGGPKISFNIPNFQIPYEIDCDAINILIEKPKTVNLSYYG